MTDIKMSECFSLPLVVVTKRDYCGEYESAIHDSFDDFMFFVPDDIDDKALIHAINSHDGLVEENAVLKTYASKGDEEIKSLDEQLAAAKAEIAEYREALECLIIEYGIHDSYDGGLLPDNEQSATVRVAINLLAKHKESK